MPIDQNDLSIQSAQLNSQIQAEEYTNRIYSNAQGNRENLRGKIKQYKDNNAGAQGLRFPLVTPKYYMRLDISEYDRNDLFSLNFQTISSIVLPMPNQLVDHNAINYSEEGLGVFAGNIANVAGAEVKNALNNSQSFPDGFMDVLNKLKVTDTDGNIINQNKFDQAQGGIKANLLQGLPGQGLQNAVIAMSGYSPNEFFTILLKTPMYKRYNFTWGFYPKNLQESNAIKDIILTLNNNSAVGLAMGGAFWKFPKVFRLSYKPSSRYLNKFKPAVLSDLQINYSPGGTPAFYAGEENPPEAVVITASFIEMEYWLQGQFTDSGGI